ncbi:MAG: riboflavin kinase [Candidatus Falkowbacteria bacterium]
MYRFKAKVIQGRGLGGRIGFPTANLDIKNLSLDYGVYLVKVRLGDKIELGLMHYGPKKTFDEAVSCEIYFKNFNKDIYGRTLEVKASRKIREVKKFEGVAELKKQIKKDLKELKNRN